MEQTHISTAFDKDLDRLMRLVQSMAHRADRQIARASKALRKGDADLVRKVVKKEERLVSLEQEVIMEVTRIIALRQPKAKDLRHLMALIKIASHFERVGAYARNIARRTEETADSASLEAGRQGIKRMAKLLRSQLDGAWQSYVNHDQSQALAVIEGDEEVDLMYNSLLREILTHMMENTKQISAGTHLLFVARSLEHIGDQLVCIAKLTRFVETGQLVDLAGPDDEEFEEDKDD